MRFFLARLMLVVVLCAAFGPAPLVAQTTKLNLGYPPANDFLPAFVAKDEGFFAKQGLDVTFYPQRVVSSIPVALSSGALDIGGLPPGVLLGAREGGLDLVSICGISRNQRRNPIISLLVKKTSPIRNANDLIGKKIGVPGLFGGLDIILRQWLLDKKIALSSVTFVEVPFPAMGDMLARDQVDAVAVIEPQRSRILSTGNAYDLTDYYTDLVDDVSLITYGTTRTWANAHRDVIARFKAKHPDETKAISVKYLGFSGPTAAFSPKLTTDDFLFYANAMRSIGLLKQPVDFSTLIFH
jgi:NitT/TauT family transport system substrate-binding protein